MSKRFSKQRIGDILAAGFLGEDITSRQQKRQERQQLMEEIPANFLPWITTLEAHIKNPTFASEIDREIYRGIDALIWLGNKMQSKSPISEFYTSSVRKMYREGYFEHKISFSPVPLTAGQSDKEYAANVVDRFGLEDTLTFIKNWRVQETIIRQRANYPPEMIAAEFSRPDVDFGDSKLKHPRLLMVAFFLPEHIFTDKDSFAAYMLNETPLSENALQEMSDKPGTYTYRLSRDQNIELLELAPFDSASPSNKGARYRVFLGFDVVKSLPPAPPVRKPKEEKTKIALELLGKNPSAVPHF